MTNIKKFLNKLLNKYYLLSNSQISNYKKNKYYLLSNYPKNNHFILKTIKILTVIFLFTSLYLFAHRHNFSSTSFSEKIFIYIINFIKNYRITMFTGMGSFLLSGITLLLNSKNKIIILQIRTLLFYLSLPELVLITCSSSFIIVCAEIKEYSAASIVATVPLALILFYCFCYFIRINNDKAYYYRDLCYCLIKSSYSHCNKFEKITNLILPDIANEYSSLEEDIKLIEYLLANVQIRGNMPQSDILDVLSCYLQKIVIPLIAKTRRTYEDNTIQFIEAFIKHIPNIWYQAPSMNIVLQCFIIIVIRECAIEYTMKQQSPEEEINNLEDILHYKEQNFISIYGIPNDPKYTECIKNIYNTYIECLHELSIINIFSYQLAEHNYMISRNLNFNLVSKNLSCEQDYLMWNFIFCYLNYENYPKGI